MSLVVSGQTFLWTLYLVTVESEVVIGPSLGPGQCCMHSHIHAPLCAAKLPLL